MVLIETPRRSASVFWVLPSFFLAGTNSSLFILFPHCKLEKRICVSASIRMRQSVHRSFFAQRRFCIYWIGCALSQLISFYFINLNISHVVHRIMRNAHCCLLWRGVPGVHRLLCTSRRKPTKNMPSLLIHSAETLEVAGRSVSNQHRIYACCEDSPGC